MSDNDYTPAERAYFESGDAGQALAEQGGRQVHPEPDGTPELSEAEQRYLDRGGDISATDLEQLRQDHGLSSRSEPSERERHDAEVRASLERKLAEYYGANRQLAETNARLAERQSMLTEALSPEPEPQEHARSQERPDPNEDIFATQQYDSDRIARLEKMVADTVRHRQHQERDQAEVDYYRQSMDQKVAGDPEFRQGYQVWLASRYAELMARRYPDATPEQVYAAVGQGRIPQDLVQKVVGEERQLVRAAVARGQNPAEAIEAAMVGRGFERASVRQWRAEQHRQAQARQRAAERQAEQAEDDWFLRVARRVAASAGSHEDALREVLPYRADRMRYREIKARRQERSWPGSGSAVQRGAW
jgi:hypothetical protein